MTKAQLAVQALRIIIQWAAIGIGCGTVFACLIWICVTLDQISETLKTLAQGSGPAPAAGTE